MLTLRMLRVQWRNLVTDWRREQSEPWEELGSSFIRRRQASFLATMPGCHFLIANQAFRHEFGVGHVCKTRRRFRKAVRDGSEGLVGAYQCVCSMIRKIEVVPDFLCGLEKLFKALIEGNRPVARDDEIRVIDYVLLGTPTRKERLIGCAICDAAAEGCCQGGEVGRRSDSDTEHRQQDRD